MTRRRVGALIVLALLGIALGTLAPVWIGSNFRTVVPDRVYRSGQLSAEELEERIRRHRIRAIVNLRGEKEDRAWYRAEQEVASRNGVVLRSIDLVPERLPPRPAVARLIDDLETLPEPILIHCSAGSDRAGFASVLARMAKEAVSLAQARSELSLRYGHVPFGPAAEIGRIYDLYEAYLREAGGEDSWPRFERWARELYVPYVYSARLSAVSFPGEIAAGERMDVVLKVANTSPGAWTFTRDQSRGIKLGVRLRPASSERAEDWLDYDRHGRFDGRLGPGEETELRIPIDAPRRPGRYELKLDMVDEHVTWFEDQGSAPLVRTLLVLPPAGERGGSSGR